MEDKIIKIQSLSYSYDKDKVILHDINASIKKGKITAILGPNGSGKSTLINVLAGVHKVKNGHIFIKDKDINEYKSSLARVLATVFQSHSVMDDLTVYQLVSFGRTPYKKMFHSLSKEDHNVIEQVLKETDTYSIKDKKVNELSGGMMQRVWFAMALAQQTEILFLDEITTYLDIYYQLELLELIRNLNKDKGVSVVMILHDINLAMQYCDEVIVMKDGRILMQGDCKKDITEYMIKEAFDVDCQMIHVDDKNYCILRKGE